MPTERRPVLAFNRGILDRLGLARTDIDRAALSAEVMTNWRPRTLGSMMLRAGSEYIGTTNDNGLAKTQPFEFTEDDAADLEFTDNELQVLIDDEVIARPAVTAATTNGNFDANVTNWTDNDEGSAASAWLTGGYLALLGTGTSAAIRTQQVAVSQAGTEHALRIVIARGPVVLRVGSTAGGDDYLEEMTLGTGTHSLAFTPTGDFYIRVMNARSFTTLVDSINVESSGAMTLPTPWSDDDFNLLRWHQTNDVVYVTDGAQQQRKIIRVGQRSWSIVLYEPETGPFRQVNTTPITIAASATSGDITLTASKAFFKSTNVGCLMRAQSPGQNVEVSVTAADTFTDPILVTGTGESRRFGISISGTFVANLMLQYSAGSPGSWVDLAGYAAPASQSYLDGLDNQDIYYRIGCKLGNYTSGTADLALSYSSGSITGIARVTAYTSPTVVSAIALSNFGSTDATEDWWEGAWSDRRGWPSAVVVIESRLSFTERGGIRASITDAPEDFDDTFEGDAGPIARSIGEGLFERIPWVLSLGRLVIGTLKSAANLAAIKVDGNNPLSVRSSSFDEPLTPTNFQIKSAAPAGAYIDRSRTRLMRLGFDLNESDYLAEDLSLATPNLCRGDKRMAQIAVQYRPDLTYHIRRDDGTVAILVHDKAENLLCWFEYETNGFVEDIYTKRAEEEDSVYYVIRRTINGSTVRYREKFALESECSGFPDAYLADAHYRYSGAATTTITGLGYLEGETVVVWGWNTDEPFTDDLGNTIGKDMGTFTVSGAQITGLPDEVTNACIGIGYTAQWKSGKQAFGAALGTAFTVKGKISHIGLIMADTHAQGIQYGRSFDELYDLPAIEQERTADPDRIWEEYDEPLHDFPMEWSTDERVCLQAASPRPCTILALVVQQTKNG